MKKKILIRIAVVCHLLIVILGASHIFDLIQSDSLFTKSLNVYNNLSFAGQKFNFFAKITIDTKISFLTENDKKELEPAYFDIKNAETEYRLIGMKAFFYRDTIIQDLLALSWGVNILNNHARAEKVHVAVDICDFPTMEEYQDGKKPNWGSYYYTVIEVN